MPDSKTTTPKKKAPRRDTRPRGGAKKRPPGRPRLQPPSDFDARVAALLTENPAATDKELRAHFGVGEDVFTRWKGTREGTPFDLDLLRARARAVPLKRLDDAMLRAAEVEGNAAAAKLAYQRFGGLEEWQAQQAAAAKAAAPQMNFTLNVTQPGGETTRLIKDIRGEIEHAAGPGAPANQRHERMLPGSTFLKHPGDDAIVIEQRPADPAPEPEPDHAAAAPGSPSPEPEQSTRG